MNKSLPRDDNGYAIQIVPSLVALAGTYDAAVSTSTTVTFTAGAAFLEVTALNQGIFLKWGGTASSASFDEFILGGTTRHYAIPVDASTSSLYTTAQFIEQSAGAILIVIEK